MINIGHSLFYFCLGIRTFHSSSVLANTVRYSPVPFGNAHARFKFSDWKCQVFGLKRVARWCIYRVRRTRLRTPPFALAILGSNCAVRPYRTALYTIIRVLPALVIILLWSVQDVTVGTGKQWHMCGLLCFSVPVLISHAARVEASFFSFLTPKKHASIHQYSYRCRICCRVEVV